MPNATFYDGQTATNPQTGERIVYRKGRWTPAGAGAAPSLSPTDQKYLTDLREKAAKTLNTATQAGRFVDLNKETGTGGLLGQPIIPLPRFMGTAPLMGDVAAAVGGNPKWAELKSITSAVAPGLRPPGSGSSSDTDVKFYREGFPNVQNTGPANQHIQRRIQAESNQDAARAAFMDRYAQTHGSLLGGESAFQRYWADRGNKLFGQGAVEQQYEKPAAPTYKYLGTE